MCPQGTGWPVLTGTPGGPRGPTGPGGPCSPRSPGSPCRERRREDRGAQGSRAPAFPSQLWEEGAWPGWWHPARDRGWSHCAAPDQGAQDRTSGPCKHNGPSGSTTQTRPPQRYLRPGRGPPASLGPPADKEEVRAGTPPPCHRAPMSIPSPEQRVSGGGGLLLPHRPSVLQPPPMVPRGGCAPRSRPRSPAARRGPGARVCLPAHCGHPAPLGRGPPVREQGRRAEAVGQDRGAVGQPPAPYPLTLSPGRPRSPGSPCGVGRGVSIVAPEQEPSRAQNPRSAPRGEGGTHPCTRGATGALHALQERHDQQWGMGGKEGVLGACPQPLAQQDPQLSRRILPVLLS